MPFASIVLWKESLFLETIKVEFCFTFPVAVWVLILWWVTASQQRTERYLCWLRQVERASGAASGYRYQRFIVFRLKYQDNRALRQDYGAICCRWIQKAYFLKCISSRKLARLINEYDIDMQWAVKRNPTGVKVVYLRVLVTSINKNV